VLALIVLAGLFLLVPQDLYELGRTLAAAVFFYANWLFYTQIGYFDGPAVEKPLLHTWSLAVEEQFYLIWPVLLFAFYRIAGREALPRLIVGLLLLSLMGSQLALDQNAAQAFYLLPYRAWELLLGGFLATLHSRPPSRIAALSAAVLGLCAIGYSAAAFDTTTPFPGFHAVLPCGGAALLIFAGASQNRVSAFVLSASPLRFIGKISYSLYLIHWPIFSFTRIALDRDTTQLEGLAIIAVSIAAAALSWRFIETPARKAKIGFPALVGVSAAATVTLGLCGILFHVTNGLPFRVSKGVMEADAAREGGQKKNVECGKEAALGPLGCAIGSPPHGTQYDFVVWGDSHARHLALAFSGQAAQRGLAGIVVSSGGCGPFIHDSRLLPACVRDAEHIERWIKTQRDLKLVFLAGYWTLWVNGGVLTVPDGDLAQAGERPGHPGLASTLQLLRSLNVPIAIVEDVPAFPHNAGLCAARARMLSRSDQQCLTLAKSDFDRTEREASAILHIISDRFGIPLINTADAFCDGEACHAEMGGAIYYRDKTHLNKAGSLYLGSKLQIPWPDLKTADRGSTALSPARFSQ
jgi:peptidoglycan/LPS O-acetylase OafA/YrhL